jgi:hypothetical protein
MISNFHLCNRKEKIYIRRGQKAGGGGEHVSLLQLNCNGLSQKKKL